MFSRLLPAAGAALILAASQAAFAHDDKAGDIAVQSPVSGMAQIHEMSMADGVKMRELPDGIAVPAGKSVSLEPGGSHVMLMDLKAPLAEGTRVP